MIKTIDECFFQIQNGANIKQGNADGGFPITRIETTANDKFNRDRMGYAGITDIVKYKKYILEDGDLLMSHINSMQYLGRTVLYVKQPNETIIHGMNLLRLKARRDVINPSYARYCFYGHKFRSQIGNITKKSVNQASFAVKDLKQIKIDIPALDEQIKIAGILDKLQKLIDMRNEELEAFDNFVKSRFIEMFDGEYPEETLFNLCNIIDYRGKTPEKVESGLPFITAKNVKMHHMALEPREYISKEIYDKVMVRGVPKEGDVVFTTEAPLGNVCRIPHFDTEFYIGQRIVTMQTEELNPIYLEYALSAEEFVRKYMRKSSGSTVKGIRVRLLEQLTIPVPLRVLQDDFANFVLQTDKSKYYNFTSYKYCVLAANLIRQEWMLCQTLSF